MFTVGGVGISERGEKKKKDSRSCRRASVTVIRRSKRQQTRRASRCAQPRAVPASPSGSFGSGRQQLEQRQS